MKTTDFKEWDRVIYIPPQANGDYNHKDCENGVVHSVSDKYVFVRYIHHGTIENTSKATNPDLLIKD
jgi:hypothetical protein